ncbi:MAG: hypothetical protein WDN24_06590 [Sphingomonas sp.]
MRPLLFIAAVMIAARPEWRRRPAFPKPRRPAIRSDCRVAEPDPRDQGAQRDGDRFRHHRGQDLPHELPYSCSGLARNDGFIHRSSTNTYCSLDTITVFDGATRCRARPCGLGEFQPVTLAK